MRGGRRPPGSNDSCAVANVMSLRVIPIIMAQELNPNCNCPKTECPRHGDCIACVEAHKAVEGGKIPYCLRFMVKVQGI